MSTTTCRDCHKEVSTQALMCPHCGAHCPYKPEWDGWGFEYKSRAEFWGLPLVHVAFKFRPNFRPVVANGWLAIGQFSCGIVNVSQFGVGPVCISQFSLACVALSQITAAVYAACQLGVVYDGVGQVLLKLKDVL